jgi:flagellar protein FliS
MGITMSQKPINRRAIEGYGRGAVESEVNYASPYRIIQMLMEGALTRLATAKGCIERGDIAEKGRQIVWCMKIVDGLRASLDPEQGGEIAGNLEALYDYISRRLLEANVSNDVAIIEEATGLLEEIKAGWDAIPSEFH